MSSVTEDDEKDKKKDPNEGGDPFKQEHEREDEQTKKKTRG